MHTLSAECLTVSFRASAYAHGLSRRFSRKSRDSRSFIGLLCLAVLHSPRATKSEPCERTCHCGAAATCLAGAVSICLGRSEHRTPLRLCGVHTGSPVAHPCATRSLFALFVVIFHDLKIFLVDLPFPLILGQKWAFLASLQNSLKSLRGSNLC